MNSSEQQINKQLNQAEEQQELNHIRWLLTKNTKQNFFIGKSKEEDISEWISHKEQTSQTHKKNLLNYFKTKEIKEAQKSNRYNKLLDIIHQNDNKSFLQYAKIQTHKMKKPHQKVPSPNRVNLKFSIPTFLQHYPANSEELQIKKNSLPLIKKIIVPINFLRNIDKNDKNEKKRETNPEEQRNCRFLFREHSQSLWSARDKSSEQSYRKGRLMGATKRAMKGFHSCNNKKNQRKSLDSNKLQECITFLK